MKTKKKLSKKFKYILKFLFTIFLFIIIFKKIDVSSYVPMIKNISWIAIISVLIIGLMDNVFSSLKWFIFLQIYKIKISFFKTLRFYFIGNFFNFFLPSSFGGDVPKWILLSRENVGHKKEILFSIALDRFFGLIALIVLSIFPFFLNYSIIPGGYVFPVILIYIIALILLFIFLFKNHLVSTIITKLKLPFRKKILNFIAPLEEFSYHSSLFKIIFAFCFALLFQFGAIIIHFIISRAIGLNIPFYVFFIILPIASILLLIPISIQGLGYRESLYIFLFGAFGFVLIEKIVLLALIINSLRIVWSLVGGIIYLLNK